MKDLVKFNRKACKCGRTFLRLDGGILGRSDDMFQSGGVNVFPSAIENLIRKVDNFSNEYQIVVPKKENRKRIIIRVEPVSDKVSQKEMQNSVDRFIEDFKYSIMFTPVVEVSEPGELPRFEGKAKRLIRET